jgi:ketosteroid isomerase-like protein
MKRHAAAIVLASCLAACGGPASEGQDAVAAVDAFGAALRAGDAPRALSWLAPDVLIYEFGGQEASRDEYAAHHLKADMDFLAAATVQQLDRRQSVAGDLALVTTRTRVTGQYKDKPFDQLGTETMVLRRAGGAWRITHIHWSSRAAPKG